MKVYEAIPGEHVERAASMICEMAVGESVTCDFNGIKLVANPGDKPEPIVEAYFAESERRAEVYRNDPQREVERQEAKNLHAREMREYVAKLATANEAELRDTECVWPESVAEVNEIIGALTNRQHAYGTCVYAMSLAAMAAFHFVAKHLGVTGFQASCADMDFIGRTRHMKRFKIVDMSNLLYPQYLDKFKNASEEIEANKEWLAAEAAKKLSEVEHASKNVIAHWKMLAALGGK